MKNLFFEKNIKYYSIKGEKIYEKEKKNNNELKINLIKKLKVNIIQIL